MNAIIEHQLDTFDPEGHPELKAAYDECISEHEKTGKQWRLSSAIQREQREFDSQFEARLNSVWGSLRKANLDLRNRIIETLRAHGADLDDYTSEEEFFNSGRIVLYSKKDHRYHGGVRSQMFLDGNFIAEFSAPAYQNNGIAFNFSAILPPESLSKVKCPLTKALFKRAKEIIKPPKLL